MPNQNDSQIKDKLFSMKLSMWEIAMVVELRKFAFGTFKVFKTNNQPMRITQENSKLLKPEEIVSILDVANQKVK